jgi:pimeloyl-ACP methyl ester carboxylesterase
MKLRRDGVALGYAESGHGDPPILLVHGWGTDRSVMAPLFAYAERAHRAVSIDLRGFGESDAPAEAYTVRGYSDDLAFVATELALERPVVIGHSMGGLVAVDFAARYGDRVSAVVILESMVAASEHVLAGLRPVLDAIRTDRRRDVLAGLMTHLTGPRFDAAERARMVSFITACPPHVLISAMEDMIAFDSARAAARVTCPLLYVGTSATYADLDRLRALCPQLVTEQIEGCGHYFPLEAPDSLIAIVARFLETHVEMGTRRRRC